MSKSCDDASAGRDGRTPCGVFNAVLGGDDRERTSAALQEGIMGEDRASAVAKYRREIVSKYGAAYQSYATKLCGDPSRAELAMRAAFSEAFRSLRACGSPERFATWFFEILTEQCERAADGRATRALRIDDLAHDVS